MQNDLYLIIGILMGFIFILAAVVIIISFPRLRSPKPTTLGDLRKLLSKVQDDVQQTQERIWDYGSKEEEKSQNWRIACTSVIGKAVSVLQSCWFGREQDATSQAVYDELLNGLKSVGLREIKPNMGQEVTEDDRQYSIKRIEGKAPYKVSKLLCPGYSFKSEKGEYFEKYEYILIEPALIEVKGNLSSSIDK
jgi:hypothetical protein